MGHFSVPAVRVLSVLGAGGESSQDPLGSLKPFFEPIVRDLAGEIFDSVTVADHLNDTYYWRIPSDVVEAMTPRFEEWGWLEQVLDGEKKAYLVSSKIESEGADVAHGAVFDDIKNQFSKFVTTHFSERCETPDELVDLLIEWLVSVDGFSVDRLTKHITAIRKDESGKFITEVEQPPGTNSLTREQTYMCARFARHLFDRNDPLKETLCKFAQVGLLTEVVHDFANPSAKVENVNLVVYLDSPLALDALGMSGDAAKQSVSIVLDGLRQIGASVCVLRHSISELQASLKGVLGREIKDRTGPTADAMKRGEITARQVAAVQAGTESYLAKINISVDERTLSSYPSSHKYFSREIYTELLSTYKGWQDNDLACEHDSTLVAVVMRRRGDLKAHDFLKSGHLAVSRNGTVIADAERLCLRHNLIARGQVPPVVHFRSLSTMAWLRTGFANGDKLSRSMLLASCNRILSLNPKLVIQAIEKAKEHAADEVEDLEMLLSIERSSLALSDATYGDARVLGYKDIGEIIHSMNEALVEERVAERTSELQAELRKHEGLIESSKAELSTQYAEQLESVKAEFTEEKATSERKLEEIHRRLSELALVNEQQTEKNELLQLGLKSAEADREAVIQALVGETNQSIKLNTYALMSVVAGVGIGTCWLSFSDELSGVWVWCAVSTAALSFLIFFLSALNLFFGIDVSARRILEPLSVRRLKRLARRRGLTPILEGYRIAFEGNKLVASKRND